MNIIAKTEGLTITLHAIIKERHRVVDELLDILYHMQTEVLVANGYSIIPKIRDIGSALLDQLRTGSHGRTLEASVNLDRLLAKLENLDLQPTTATPYFDASAKNHLQSLPDYKPNTPRCMSERG